LKNTQLKIIKNKLVKLFDDVLAFPRRAGSTRKHGTAPQSANSFGK
jgi:hypothetical protein